MLLWIYLASLWTPWEFLEVEFCCCSIGMCSTLLDVTALLSKMGFRCESSRSAPSPWIRAAVGVAVTTACAVPSWSWLAAVSPPLPSAQGGLQAWSDRACHAVLVKRVGVIASLTYPHPLPCACPVPPIQRPVSPSLKPLWLLWLIKCVGRTCLTSESQPQENCSLASPC